MIIEALLKVRNVYFCALRNRNLEQYGEHRQYFLQCLRTFSSMTDSSRACGKPLLLFKANRLTIENHSAQQNFPLRDNWKNGRRQIASSAEGGDSIEGSDSIEGGDNIVGGDSVEDESTTKAAPKASSVVFPKVHNVVPDKHLKVNSFVV